MTGTAASFDGPKALGDVNDPDATRGEIGRHWQAGANTTTETGLWFKAALDVRRAAGHLAVPFALCAALCAARHGHCRRVRHGVAGKVPGLFPGDLARPSAKRTSTATRTPMWIATGLLGTSRSAARLSTPSGTSTLAGAAISTVLAGFYCTDRAHFPVHWRGGERRDAPLSQFFGGSRRGGRLADLPRAAFPIQQGRWARVRPECGPRDCHDAAAPRGPLRRDLLHISAVKVFQISLLRRAGRRSPVQDVILVDGPRVGLFSVPAAVM